MGWDKCIFHGSSICQSIYIFVVHLLSIYYLSMRLPIDLSICFSICLYLFIIIYQCI